MEHHSGLKEKTEVFRGQRFRVVGHARSKVRATEIQHKYMRKGYHTHREQENRRPTHWNVYARKKK
jgi:hypothetical protein